MLKQLLASIVLLESCLSLGIYPIDADSMAFGKVTRDDPASCPVDLPFSCTNSTPIADSCCFESPGGILLLTQFWDYYPPIGGNETFTLHGLWPDNCDGTYEQFCDDSLNVSNVTDIVLREFGDEALYDKMVEYWKNFNGNDESLWLHEFNKHATCISTIKPKCYGSEYKKYQNAYDFYNLTLNLYEQLPTFEFLKEEGIVPSLTQKYTKKQIDEALTKHFGKKVYFSCNKYNALQEIWYYHHLKGPLLEGAFAPIDTIVNSKCPEEDILFIPKNKFTPPPQPPKSPYSGYLKSSGKKGCLISNGKWYESGTCATYNMDQLQFGGYNIKSSKGYCGVNSDGQFNCNKQNTPQKYQFQYNKDSQQIGYGGSFDWCFDTDHKSGSGSNAQTPVKLSDGKCQSFKINLEAK